MLAGLLAEAWSGSNQRPTSHASSAVRPPGYTSSRGHASPDVPSNSPTPYAFVVRRLAHLTHNGGDPRGKICQRAENQHQPGQGE